MFTEGAACAQAARARNTQAALDLEVELEDGRNMVIVQEQDDEIAPADHVRAIRARE